MKTETTHYPGEILYELTKFMVAHPGVEIKLNYNRRLEAIAIRADLTEPIDGHMVRIEFEHLQPVEEFHDAYAPEHGHTLATGFDQTLRKFSAHFDKLRKDDHG